MIQVPVPPTPPDPDLIFLNQHGPVIVMVVLAVLTAATIILWPIMRALGRRMEGKAAGGAEVRAELDELRHHLGEVDALQARVAELEERLDFTERMLVRGQESAPEMGRLPRP
jgi:Tfp pilus assembly protein PilO